MTNIEVTAREVAVRSDGLLIPRSKVRILPGPILPSAEPSSTACLDPRQRVERFGRTNYGIMLCDCLWHVYAMLGKLHRRAYALSRA